MIKAIRESWPLVLVALVVLAARSSLADHYAVPTGSMEPTLLPGDRVLVDKTAYGLRLPFTDWMLYLLESPRRGDVVIFDSPEDGTRLIKRVVALPGDLVSLESGRLRINGRPLADPASPRRERFCAHAVELDLRFGGGVDIVPTRVPPGHVLVLGDSRGNGRDSRFFGAVPIEGLYARALGIYYRSGEGPVWLPLSPEG